ncbi:subtilisin-like serine protease pr1c [Colletotrichum tofieldiae]|nr:subtilisin-like serine protease pr1c [Colletotrichum tofieldiae]GKT77493.1 subtilisin-like serine protease pr1c [Colletotrichum tofieldiae]
MKSLFKQVASVACLPWLATAAFNGALVVEFDGSVQLTSETLIGQTQISLAESGLDCTASSRYYFTHPLFKGASFNINCKNDGVTQKSVVMNVQSIDGILKAWPVTFTQPAIQNIRIPSISDGGETSRGFGKYQRDLSRRSPAHIRDEDLVDTFSTHIDTGVSKLHATNVTGSGIRVAVIDSGFDVDASGLSKTKITYAHDLTDDDNDVRDDCSIHGTHVLGIVGAKGNEAKYGVTGVAPDATYEVYRIQACEEQGASVDMLINAFLEAADRGVDIPTCSYGGGLGFPEATRLFENGTFISLPTGNGGPGIFSGGSPGSADAITSVGSADNSVTPYYTWEGNWTAGEDAGPLRFIPGTPFDFPPNKKLTVWTSNTPISRECQLLPDNTTLPANLSNVIFLSQYNQCWKAPNGTTISLTQEFGIPYALYYSSSNFTVSEGPLFIEVTRDRSLKGAATVDFATASQLLRAKQQHGSVEVFLANDVAVANEDLTYKANNRSGLLSSSFTSWGPSLRASSMPLFLAPGGNILSTFPEKLGGWGVIGGTSMATPFAAGVAALVKQQHPDYTPEEIQAVIATTARPVKWNDSKGKTEDFLAPTFQQGGGLVDAWNAVHSTTLLSTASLSFNDTTNRPEKLTFSIKNTDKFPTTYHLSHVGASSGYVLEKADWYNLTKAQAYPVYADVSITPSTVTVEPGKSAIVSVSIIREPSLPNAAALVSHFGGYVAIEAEGSVDVNKLSLPYTGFGAPLSTLRIINRADSYQSVWNLTGSTPSKMEEGRVFTCTLNTTADVPATFPDNIYPGVEIVLFMQTRDMSISIMDANSGKEIVKSYQSTPVDTWGPGSTWYWDGSDGDKAFVPAGTYIWHVKALKLNGHPEKKEDWDIYETGKWVLKYASNSTLFTSNSTSFA